MKPGLFVANIPTIPYDLYVIQRRYVFLNGKGGSGKTTAAMLVACALANGELPVALHDLDEQETATSWLRGLDNPLLSLAGSPDGRGAEPPCAIVVDTPGRLDDGVLARALEPAASALIVVTRATAPDLWTAQRSIEWLRERALNVPIRVLFNAVKANTKLSAGVDGMAKGLGVKRLKSILHDRQAYARAATEGWGALGSEARQEVMGLVMELGNTLR